MRLDGSQPVRYGIKMELDDKYRRLKEIVSDMCGVALANLRLAEVYGATVKVPTDTHTHTSLLKFYPLPIEFTGRHDKNPLRSRRVPLRV